MPPQPMMAMLRDFDGCIMRRVWRPFGKTHSAKSRPASGGEGVDCCILLPLRQGEVGLNLLHRALVVEGAITVREIIRPRRPWAADVSAANAAHGGRFDLFDAIFHTMSVSNVRWP